MYWGTCKRDLYPAWDLSETAGVLQYLGQKEDKRRHKLKCQSTGVSHWISQGLFANVIVRTWFLEETGLKNKTSIKSNFTCLNSRMTREHGGMSRLCTITSLEEAKA